MSAAPARPGGTAAIPLRFLALGDSYTIGEGVHAADRWPVRLVELLRARGHQLSEPQIVARTAWTTAELMDALAEAMPAGPFDLVSLMIGVNDQYRSRPVDQFEASFLCVLDQAISFAAAGARRVIVISIPDWGATPFADGRDRALIGREIDAYNACARRVVESRGARWHDVTELSRRVAEDPSLVVDDRLHPSGAMYGQWALSLVDPIEEMLAGGAASAIA